MRRALVVSYPGPRCSALARDGGRCRREAVSLALRVYTFEQWGALRVRVHTGGQWRCRCHRAQAVRLKWLGRSDEFDVMGARLPGGDPAEATATLDAQYRRERAHD